MRVHLYQRTIQLKTDEPHTTTFIGIEPYRFFCKTNTERNQIMSGMFCFQWESGILSIDVLLESTHNLNHEALFLKTNNTCVYTNRYVPTRSNILIIGDILNSLLNLQNLIL